MGNMIRTSEFSDKWLLGVNYNIFGEGNTPTYGTEHSAGMDIYSAEEVEIRPGEIKMVHTNFATEIPQEYVALLFARSGLSVRSGIGLANGVGVIDSDYRGEWLVGLINNNPVENKFTMFLKNIVNRIFRKPLIKPKTYRVLKGERIAQFIIFKYPTIVLNEVNSLSDSDRGDKGFGSTGN